MAVPNNNLSVLLCNCTLFNGRELWHDLWWNVIFVAGIPRNFGVHLITANLYYIYIYIIQLQMFLTYPITVLSVYRGLWGVLVHRSWGCAKPKSLFQPFFFFFWKLKTPLWAKKHKRTELWRGSTYYARLL